MLKVRTFFISIVSLIFMLSTVTFLSAQADEGELPDKKFIEFSKRFDDRAGVLSENELAAISDAAEKQENKMGIKAFLLIMPEISEWDVDEYARDLFNHWRSKGIVDNKSYLLLISIGDKKFQPMRGKYIDEREHDYEVYLLRSRFLNEFTEGNYGNAIVNFINGMSDMPTLKKTLNSEKTRNQKAQWYMLIGIIILILVFMRMTIKRRMEERKRDEEKRKQGPFIE